MFNAGATRPLPEWLDALLEGGRLVFPLITDEGWGVALKVLRRGAGFWTWVVNQICFIGCAGATDPDEGEAVAESYRRGDLLRARSLRRGTDPAIRWCWAAPAGGRRRACCRPSPHPMTADGIATPASSVARLSLRLRQSPYRLRHNSMFQRNVNDVSAAAGIDFKRIVTLTTAGGGLAWAARGSVAVERECTSPWQR